MSVRAVRRNDAEGQHVEKRLEALEASARKRGALVAQHPDFSDGVRDVSAKRRIDDVPWRRELRVATQPQSQTDRIAENTTNPHGNARIAYALCRVAICQVLPHASSTMQRRSPYGMSAGASTERAPAASARA